MGKCSVIFLPNWEKNTATSECYEEISKRKGTMSKEELEENEHLTERDLNTNSVIFQEARDVKKWLGLEIPGWNRKHNFYWER